MIAAWALAATLATGTGAVPERIVALGGAVTETLFALGVGDRVVAVDDSSSFPAEANRLPKVGYYRSIGAEGVLSLRPTLVVATDEAGPPAALAQLQAAGVRVARVSAGATRAAAMQRIRAIAEMLGVQERGKALLASLEASLAQAAALQEQVQAKRPKVLFVFSPTSSTLLVAGKGTAAAEIVSLAGGRLAMDGYDGYKPVSAEALIASAPDVVLVTQATLDSLGGADALWKLPGLASTPAGAHRRLVALDDLLVLGFGPRTGEAVQSLARALLESLP